MEGAPAAKRAKFKKGGGEKKKTYQYTEMDWKEFDPKKLIIKPFSEYEGGGNGGGFVEVLYRDEDGELIHPIFTAPLMRVGCDVTHKHTPGQDYRILMSQLREDESEETEGFIRFLDQLEEWFKKKHEKHKDTWFASKGVSKFKEIRGDVVIRETNKETGEPYKPSWRIAMPVVKDSAKADFQKCYVPVEMPVRGEKKARLVDVEKCTRGSLVRVKFFLKSITCSGFGCHLKLQGKKVALQPY